MEHSGAEPASLRVAQLEAQVRMLSAALGVDPDDPASVVSDEVVELARTKDTDGAIRLLREQTGMRLVAAKRAVDAARRR